jgi:hypothetical protein
MLPDCYCVCHSGASSRPSCEHCEGLFSLPGVKRVEMETILHVSIIVDDPSEEQRNAIYDEEMRLLQAYPDIPFDFNLCRGDS